MSETPPTTHSIASDVVSSLSGAPFVLTLVIVNVMSLFGFGFVLYSVSNAMERREGLIEKCIERRSEHAPSFTSAAKGDGGSSEGKVDARHPEEGR